MCSEKQNDFYVAATGYSEAAFLEKDKKKSFELLQNASNYYKMHGTTNAAHKAQRQFAQKLLDLEGYEEMGLKIYEQIFEDLFIEDNYVYNSDAVNEYLGTLVRMKKFPEAIKIKRKFN